MDTIITNHRDCQSPDNLLIWTGMAHSYDMYRMVRAVNAVKILTVDFSLNGYSHKIFVSLLQLKNSNVFYVL